MTELNEQNSSSPYQSYLLRIWMDTTGSQTPWRIALINLRTGSRQGFVDFEHLAKFLKEALPDELK